MLRTVHQERDSRPKEVRLLLKEAPMERYPLVSPKNLPAYAAVMGT